MPGRGGERLAQGGDGNLLTSPRLKHDRSPLTTPERPRKKLKLEIKVPASSEVAENRDFLRAFKLKRMSTLKTNYRENLLELCFLQDMGNIVDFPTWKKKPPAHVGQALKASRLDSDDEDEDVTDKSLDNEVNNFRPLSGSLFNNYTSSIFTDIGI